MKSNHRLLAALAGLTVSAFSQTADTIYHNGTVLTIDDANPRADAIADMKKAGAGIQSGDHSELAFTRAISAIAGDADHAHQGHTHGGGCLCGAMAKIANIVAEGNQEQ